MTDCKAWHHHLSEQLCKVLEDTAFMLVEDPDAPLPTPTEAVEASLNFSGKQTGTCYLAVSTSAAKALATEMLGADQSPPETNEANDNAVGELLNILTAWLLDDWWGDNVPHTLGLPNTKRLPMTQTRVWSVPNDCRVVVTTDSGATFMSCIILEE